MFTVGIGFVRPPEVEPSRYRAVLLAGLAGGLDPSLAVGDLVLDGGAGGGMRRGLIHTSPTIVSTANDKARLFAATGALAVDMEGLAARGFAKKLNLPFLHLRAISDAATDGLDPALLNWVDSFGKPRPLAAAAGLLRDPRRVAGVIRLARASRVALKRLSEGVRMLTDTTTAEQAGV